ncbi:MAG: hypothetical protein K2N47_05600 [Clostridia bacterium]|nr:hypothetical protein [Clostridia bacterium]
MLTVKQKLKYIFATIVAMTLVFIATLACDVNALVFADTESGSSILDDLSKDETFDVLDYPIKNDDYSLEVIQIAESTAGELLVYVYQPSGEAGGLRASRISIALEADNDKGFTPVLYNLEYINSRGSLYKYKVKNFTVSSDPVRYYNLIMIQRKAIAGVDTVAEGNELNYKAYRVGQYWQVKDTEDGGLNYSVVNSDVVEIKNPYHGIVDKLLSNYEYIQNTIGERYYLESHYLAFSTDWDIDKLVNVSISFVTCDNYYFDGVYHPIETTREEREKIIYSDEEFEVQQTGYGRTLFTRLLFGGNKTFSWKSIQSTDEFLNSVNASDTTREKLSGTEWVVYFYNSSALNGKLLNNPIERYLYTQVEQVTVLRLEFVSDGVCYNLGAVSDTVSKDYGYNGGGSAIIKGLPEWAKLLIAGAVGAIIGVVVCVIVGKKRGD